MTDEQLAACHEAGREIVRLTAERDEAVALLRIAENLLMRQSRPPRNGPHLSSIEEESRECTTGILALLARLAPPATKPEGM